MKLKEQQTKYPKIVEVLDMILELIGMQGIFYQETGELITVTSCGIQKIYYQFVGKLNIAFLYSMGTFIHHYEKTSSFLEKVKTNQLIDKEQVN